MRGYNKRGWVGVGGGGQAVPFSTHNHVPKLKLLLFSYNISFFKNETDSAGVKR